MIDAVELKSFRRDRKDVFKIATGSSDTMENLFVKVVSGDDFGVGAGAPNSVTKETLESMEQFVSCVRPRLLGTDETDILKLHQRLDAAGEGNAAAKAALDIAVLDLMSKRDGRPLYEYLGGTRSKMLTDMTIGIESRQVAVEKALKYCREGFRALKMKVGLGIEEDIKRVGAVREAVGPLVGLRVDANQGYSVDEAVRFAEEMETLDIEFIEQPVKAEDRAALKEVTDKSAVPIMADECVMSSSDARAIARRGIADMINIKLMKSGGIQDASRIDILAEAAGIETMVGCMGEMQLPVAAGLHFALSSENIKYADLDSFMSVVDDPTSGLRFEDGYLIPSSRPGLGMTTPLDS